MVHLSKALPEGKIASQQDMLSFSAEKDIHKTAYRESIQLELAW
jgi:hypothetical protein